MFTVIDSNSCRIDMDYTRNAYIMKCISYYYTEYAYDTLQFIISAKCNGDIFRLYSWVGI